MGKRRAKGFGVLTETPRPTLLPIADGEEIRGQLSRADPRLTYRRANQHDLYVQGDQADGTTASFAMCVLQHLDPCNLAIEVVDRVPRLREESATPERGRETPPSDMAIASASVAKTQPRSATGAEGDPAVPSGARR